jgi:hypothetical protein
MRGKTSALVYHQLFARLTSAYPDCMVVYTDRSFVHGSTGYAFLYENQVFRYHHYSFSSMYMAELHISY